MAVRLFAQGLTKCTKRLVPFGSVGVCGSGSGRSVIGNREIVGFGVNGEPYYVDRPDFPMPALRWKETTPDIMCLREKEKGDWRKLGLDEKKALYRASFCQTFAEFNHSSGQWKSILGCAIFISTFGLWLFYLTQMFVYTSPLPETFTEDGRRAQLRHMLDIRVNPITGLSSTWDYEKDDWKT